MEAKFYYAGLPSAPVLVARTSTTPWEAPEAEQHLKELRIVGNHAPKLKEAWEGDLALKTFALLDSMGVKWTSIDIVRMGVGEERCAPVILCIGVKPAFLSGDDGLVVASKCKELLINMTSMMSM